jgi:L-amino acid N-acyltransferase YncA
VQIRSGDPASDAAACAAIYAPFVVATAISFEDDPPDEGQMRQRMEEMSARFPWLVAEAGGEVIGFAYASQHRSRAAYRWAVDVAIYVDSRHQRRGLGRALYETLFELLSEQGLRMACAGITLPNDASVALHLKLGFQPVGVYRQIGWKLGVWHDVGWYQRPLTARGPDPPVEPGPPPSPSPIEDER